MEEVTTGLRRLLEAQAAARFSPRTAYFKAALLVDQTADLELQAKRFAASALEEAAAVQIFPASAALAVLAAHAVAEVVVEALEALAAEPEGLAGRATWQSLSIEHEGRLD